MNAKTKVLALAVPFLVASSLYAQPAQTGAGLPGPFPLFPDDNWWNVDVSQAPVDAGSNAYIDFIGRDQGLHPDFGGNADEFPETYGMIYITVPGTQPLVPVTFVEYPEESDAGAPGRPAGYPIPEAAKAQPRWIEGGYPGNADAAGDRHMLIVDRDNRLLYELYHTFWNQDAGRWEAGSGAVFRLTTNGRRTEGWTSADAAGLAVLPGLIRYDEAFGSGPIEHAFRFTVRSTNGHAFPASHTAGSRAGAPPMGARLRLKASKDIAGYPAEVRRIFQAMKTYGLILADNGTDMYVTGTHDTRWNNDVLNPAFASLEAGDFEVIQLGWKPGANPPLPESCTPSATRLCMADNRFSIEARWTRPNNDSDLGRAVLLTRDTGYFWFFDSANVEMVIKVIDGCGVNGRYWVFAGGLTDVRVRITVTDTWSGVVRTYTNPQGTAFRPIQDTGAFGCPTSPPPGAKG